MLEFPVVSKKEKNKQQESDGRENNLKKVQNYIWNALKQFLRKEALGRSCMVIHTTERHVKKLMLSRPHFHSHCGKNIKLNLFRSIATLLLENACEAMI